VNLCLYCFLEYQLFDVTMATTQTLVANHKQMVPGLTVIAVVVPIIIIIVSLVILLFLYRQPTSVMIGQLKRRIVHRCRCRTTKPIAASAAATGDDDDDDVTQVYQSSSHHQPQKSVDILSPTPQHEHPLLATSSSSSGAGSIAYDVIDHVTSNLYIADTSVPVVSESRF